jgi:hypothetical protein
MLRRSSETFIDGAINFTELELFMSTYTLK